VSDSSYVMEAFKLKPNLIFVGVGLAAGMIIGSPLLLGGVAAGEVLYLAAMSSNPRFRRAIRSLRLRS
jgi:hypothetical protein